MAITTVLWLLTIIFINPIVNFPIGDDWSYARSVEFMINTGTFRVTGWTSMPLLGQTIWGAGFAYILGFSHTTLRLSVLVLALLGGFSIYGILGLFELKKSSKFFITNALLYSPFFIVFSFTFATDIPFASFFLASIYFLIRFLKNSRKSDLILGICFTIYAGLIRDLSLAIPPAFALALFFAKGINRKTVVTALGFILIVIVQWFGFRIWLEYIMGSIPFLYDDAHQRLIRPFGFSILPMVAFFSKNILLVLVFMSFFSLPLSINIFIKKYKELLNNRLFLTVSILFALINCCCVLFMGFDIFLTEYMYTEANLTNALTIAHNYAFFPNVVLKICIAIVSCIAGFIFPLWIVSIINYFKTTSKFEKSSIILLISTLLIYLLPITIARPFNRYLIIPLILLYIAASLMYKESSAKFSKLTLFFMLCYAFSGIAGAHDLLSLMKARYNIITRIESLGAPPSVIDGGFEYNGWHLYNSKYKAVKNKNWWWVYNDNYAVLNGIPKNYEVIYTEDYFRMFPLGFKGTVFGVKKKAL